MVAAVLILACTEVPSLIQSRFTGKVVAVLDGDSLMVLDGRQQVEVRLHGVDAPERGQAFGNVCRRTLSNLAFGKTAAVQVVDIDRYQRRVSRLTVDGRDVGLEMIRAGCAWHYRQFSDDAGYAAAEEEARRARRGLWQDATPVPPWTYRRLRSPGGASAGNALTGVPDSIHPSSRRRCCSSRRIRPGRSSARSGRVLSRSSSGPAQPADGGLFRRYVRPSRGHRIAAYRRLPRGAAQSSQRSPATRSNSLTFEVTSVAPRRRAWPASSTS